MVTEELCGFLNINKSRGMTSSDVVEAARKILGVNAGHTGTLDPLAEGVLVLGVGAARKFIGYMPTDKEYETVIRLGQESDTLDTDGKLTSPKPVESAPETIRAVGAELTGELELPVPVFSAVRTGGRRLYERARAGETVIPPKRKTLVHAINVIEIDLPRVRFTVSCAGGTYVRAIAAEWGRRLGCGAVVERLIRTRSGGAVLEKSTTLEKLRERANAGRVGEIVVPVTDALSHLPALILDAGTALKLQQGQSVAPPPGLAADVGQMVRLNVPRKSGDMTIGIGRAARTGENGPMVIRPYRMMPQAAPG